jgi:macrolide-specific efflux system membrane fusion protein
MIKNKKLIYSIIFIAVVIGVIALQRMRQAPKEIMQEISPATGSIQTSITSTATVQPQNRLEIKPPINGRIEQILVKEGESVKTGQILAWMSSTERAALLDAARAQGADVLSHWEDVYKATPLLSPIDGEVIVSTDEPGQTVTSSDVVVVLSDHLIVQAQVDETDIGKIKLGQEANLSLDAYPQIQIRGKVDHIYYESKIVNNVTIYQVDILPEKVPDVFRSGMSATVIIVENAKDNILTLPLGAIKRGKEGTYVLVSRGSGKSPEERKVKVGIFDDKNVEIISGLTASDKVLMASQKYKPSTTAASGTNPFMPSRRRQ